MQKGRRGQFDGAVLSEIADGILLTGDHSMADLVDLFRTGPNTLGGRYMRTLWHPIFIAAELKPGWAKRVQILREKSPSAIPRTATRSCSPRKISTRCSTSPRSSRVATRLSIPPFWKRGIKGDLFVRWGISLSQSASTLSQRSRVSEKLSLAPLSNEGSPKSFHEMIFRAWY